ncbi:N-lysine methyltransferase SETD6-like [Argonauta hians]
MENGLKRVAVSSTNDHSDGCSVSKRRLIEDQGLESFVEWCQKSNFNISPKVKVSEEGSVSKYGMIATEDISAGECLFQVPRSHILVSETSDIADLTNQVDLKSSKSDKGWVTLFLSLLYEYNNPNSKWRPYFNLVPDFNSMYQPLFWSEGSRERLLQATGIQKLVETDLTLINYDFNNIILPFVQQHSDVFSPICRNLDFYHKMVAFVMAYSFMEPTNPALDSSHEDQVTAPPIMVPLADILNHSSNHNAELSYEVSCLKMMAVKDIKKGHEVFNTYGMLSNSQLLHMYGFAEPYPHNINDIVEMPMEYFKLGAAELATHKCNVQLLEQKWNMMLNSNVITKDDGFLLGMKGFLTKHELILCLQILFMDAADFESFKMKQNADSGDCVLQAAAEQANIVSCQPADSDHNSDLNDHNGDHNDSSGHPNDPSSDLNDSSGDHSDHSGKDNEKESQEKDSEDDSGDHNDNDYEEEDDGDDDDDTDDSDEDEEVFRFRELQNLYKPWKKFLIKVAEKCLANYETSLEEDHSLLSSERLSQVAAHEKFAFYTTHSQKRLLEKLIKSCQ